MLGEHIYSRRDSEYWHGKAVEIAITFLPSESPLVSHILMSYEKHHSPSNQVIPEDEHQEVQVRVIRQIKGVDSNKLQPIIRHHNDKDFRVCSTKDIEPLDYRSIVYKIPKKLQNKGNKENMEYSIEINESSDAIDNRTDDDMFKQQQVFQRKRMSKSTNEHSAKHKQQQVSNKKNSAIIHQSIGEFDDEQNNTNEDQLTPNDSAANPKYFSMIDGEGAAGDPK